MKYKLKLKINKGFSWHQKDGIHFKGYFYIEGKSTNLNDVFSYFSGLKSKNDFLNRLIKLNGCFSIVAEIEDSIIAVSDMQGSFPIFYSFKDDILCITDDSEDIVKMTGFNSINHTALIDYLHFGCVMYNDTLVDGINIIPAMSYIYAEKNMKAFEYNKYMTLYDSEYSIDDTDFAKESLDSAFKSASLRLAESLGGKTAAVSLSGGVDSRAILMMLKIAKYKNVVCYSYGWKNNPDIEVAKSIAEAMGFKHFFIPYDRKNWKSAYKDEYTKNFIKSSHNLSAIAHMESHFVVRKLLKEKMIPIDSVFMTGHVGIMSKSHFEEDRYYAKEEIAEKIWSYYGKLYSYRGNRKKHYIERLNRYLGNKKNYPRREAESIYENAGYEMCRGKHLINSHRQFEINGCEWRLPLMDREIFSVFESMNPCVRDEKKRFFTNYIISRTGGEINEAIFKKGTLAKAYKNLRNPIYSIMRPWQFFTLGYKDCLLPLFPVRQYRFIRRFYSYCALYEIGLIKKWLDLN